MSRLDQAKKSGLVQVCPTERGITEVITLVSLYTSVPDKLWAYKLEDMLYLLNEEQHLYLNDESSTPVCDV